MYIWSDIVCVWLSVSSNFKMLRYLLFCCGFVARTILVSTGTFWVNFFSSYFSLHVIYLLSSVDCVTLKCWVPLLKCPVLISILCTSTSYYYVNPLRTTQLWTSEYELVAPKKKNYNKKESRMILIWFVTVLWSHGKWLVLSKCCFTL